MNQLDSERFPQNTLVSHSVNDLFTIYVAKSVYFFLKFAYVNIFHFQINELSTEIHNNYNQAAFFL